MKLTQVKNKIFGNKNSQKISTKDKIKIKNTIFKSQELTKNKFILKKFKKKFWEKGTNSEPTHTRPEI